MKKQWAGWGPDQQAEQHYLIEPRHLAGGGDVRHVSEFLRASGWKDKSRADGPLVFDSPDRTVRVSYDPYIQPGGWAIRGKGNPHEAEWHVTFSRQTPVEIVAGFTDALTHPRDAHAPNVWAPLQEQGWQTQRGQHYTATSPDGGAWVQYHQDKGHAHWWAGARNEHGRTWDAVFTATTPMRLIQGFSAALADPQPVMRPRGHVPPTNRIRVTSVSMLPSQLSAWQQARITAARAATWARNSWATSRPRARAASRSHTPGAGARR